ncbi:MAG: molybdopterin-dependent oxidoreductase, partial [Thermoanaerobaculia bacterium]|nr:molybdopterin-dependent oxidoreductase [Thermoanaerobaculia bacterium]
LLGQAGPVLFVHGLGLSELTQGTASVMTLCNLALLTGSVGKPGAGMLPLRGQNNVQGNADMGGMPNQVTGYQRLDDDAVRERLAAVWGKLPPKEPGLTIPEMIDGAARGEIKGLWIQGEDVVQSDPNQRHVIAALEKLDLLVVQELFLSETARYAHLVLPAVSVLEQSGTFTNGERRIQLVRPAVPPPGEARPDWEAVRDLGKVLGEAWDYPTPAEVMDEIARVAPRLFGGVSYDRLEGDGLQWPCPANDHPGTATVHADGFIRGKGQLVAIDFVPSPEHGVEGYPYLLVTGRVLEHYNVGTMTRRTPSRELVSEDRLEIHPQDAEHERLHEGDRIEIESRWGRTTVPVHLSRRVAPGTFFLPFHFPETRANLLTGPQADPQSKCPEYKVTAVRIGGR